MGTLSHAALLLLSAAAVARTAPEAWLTAIGGWGTLTPSAIAGIFVVSLLIGRLHPHSTLKRAWSETDRAWAAHAVEREARTKAEAVAYKAVEGLAKSTRVIQSLRPPTHREAGEDDADMDVAVEDWKGEGGA